MLLAFDLDNTVVTRDHQIPTQIVDAIDAARSAGHLVTVLTGRPHAAAVAFVDQLGVAPGPFGVNHGALVFGPDGAVIKHRRMSGDHVRTILSPSHLPDGVPFACIVGDSLFVNDPDDTRWHWAHTSNRHIDRFDHARIVEADKIVFGSNGASESILASLAGVVPLTSYLWGDGYLELTAQDADKGAALALIADVLGVAREDTVAFGDGTNDVSMLIWAGHSVAVGPDAPAELIAAADERIDAPEEHGVARWLDRLLG